MHFNRFPSPVIGVDTSPSRMGGWLIEHCGPVEYFIDILTVDDVKHLNLFPAGFDQAAGGGGVGSYCSILVVVASLEGHKGVLYCQAWQRVCTNSTSKAPHNQSDP